MRCQVQKLSRLALDASRLFWQTGSVMESLIRLDVGGFTLPAVRRGHGEQSEIPRFAFSKVCHSERSEESALGRLNAELQILRFAQDDRDFHPHGWAAGP